MAPFFGNGIKVKIPFKIKPPLIDLFKYSFFFRDTFAANSACRKLAVSLADSVSLRTLLSLLYTMTQVLRSHKDQQLRETFINDLSEYEPQWSKDPFVHI